jgi:hypothetical protein
MHRFKPIEVSVAAMAILIFGLIKILTWNHIPSQEMDALLSLRTADLALPSAALELGFAVLILWLLWSGKAKPACHLCLGFGLALIAARYLYVLQGGALANCPCLGGVPGLWPAIQFYKGNVLITAVLWIPMLGWSGLLRVQAAASLPG